MLKVNKITIFIIFFSLSNFLDACASNKLQKRDKLLGVKHISALILARGGSKGIPLKNISKFGNKTLITTTLEEIQDTGFNSVWVSTNSVEIFNVIESDCENIHWRSEQSATNTASSISAIAEFLEFHSEIDAVALIQCTSPFLKKKYLKQALSIFQSGKDCVFSVTRSFKLRWTSLEGRVIPLNFNPAFRPRRQDWNGEFIENGMFYIAKKNLIRNGLLQNDK